ncbi:MAG TPA: PQQ-binding-like beta-propeller repeat protein, partial [Candidatus Hydrogenedentes bacterium]|nr:PQQ-binding-like beta-propeller repeat protein [Candidatus Hydrogenedentota bacterium]
MTLWGFGAEAQGVAWSRAHDLVRDAGFAGGVCCVVGAADPDFAVAIGRESNWVVHVLETDGARAGAVRDCGLVRGLRPPRFVVEHWIEGIDKTTPLLPYADDLVDVVVALDAPPEAWSPARQEEALRVLRPGGKLYLRAASADAPWQVRVEPPQAGVDNWSHWEHGPDNNPVSNDTVIRAPYATRWLGQPYYIAMPAVTTAAGGRIFLAMGHIAHHEREEPWLNTLLARNGYNGEELWRRRLPDGYLVHRSAFIATDDTFYMIDLDGSGCLLLDPETGAEKGRIRLPDLSGEWKWMALDDGVLYVLEGKTRDPGQITVVRSENPAWSWEELSTGYYEDRIPWGFGNAVAAFDVTHGKLLWVRWEDAPIDARAMALGDGKVFFYAPDARLGALDARTGEVVWTNEDPEIRALIEEKGRGLFSTPGFRTACICVYTPEGLFFQGQAQANLVAISKDHGRLMWHRRKTSNNPNVLYVDGNVLAGIGVEGSTLALDPLTGETFEDLGFKKRSCVRLTATPDSLFVRGYPEGLTRYDRATRRIYFDGSVRPACNDGAIGANGLLYIGPWLCDCNLSLMGSVTLASAGEFDPAAFQGERVYLAEDLSVVATPVDERDWPAYRGGNAHSGASGVAVSQALLPLWTWKEGWNGNAPSDDQATFLPTAPTAAGGLVLLGGDDGYVRAIDAATGELRWRFATAGAIMQPPTAWEGRVLVGSGDGSVYAIEAATGRLLWKFRAVPVERRTMIYGALGSKWPVNTGVLVRDGVAYFAAGIIDYDGTYVYAVDAATGALKWVNNTTGHLDKE